MNPPSAAGEEKGAAGGGGGGGGNACRGAEGGGEPRSSAAGAADQEEPGLAGQKEESLEEKLKSLTFRKQVSYRKAISRSGLQHLAPVQNLNIAISNGPTKEPRMALEWTENAVNGEHLWLDTNVSGDLCYLGEESCQVKFSKSAVRRKCAACKIVVHNACMEQLEKTKFAVHSKMQESLEAALPNKQEEEEKDQPAEMEYLNSRCVLFTYFQGDIGSVVDEHFSRALNQASSFNPDSVISKSKTGPNPLWRENSTIESQRSGFPASFWTSSYQTPPPPCLGGVHHDFPVSAPSTFSTADPSNWPGRTLHQTAQSPSPSMSEPWHYPLASQVSPTYGHMHDVYMHHHHPHAHMHHHHPPTSHLDPGYRPLLMTSVCTGKIPPPHCDAAKIDSTAVTGATSAWAGAFHGTVDIVPTFGFDTGIQHQEKSKEASWF